MIIYHFSLFVKLLCEYGAAGRFLKKITLRTLGGSVIEVSRLRATVFDIVQCMDEMPKGAALVRSV